MKRVFRAALLVQVAHARNVLVTAGIPCEMRNQYLAGAMGELPMLETWPQLFVDDADEQAALRALARAASTPVGEPWICAGCGEELEPQFTSCWRCGAAPN
ncbi:MAG TPA: DUF2007 domain-containing protein [Steroidobacteraceae bacterium]